MLDFFNKYGSFILIGAIGASINKLRRRMTWSRFVRSCFIAAFISPIAGVLCLHFLALPIPVVNAICGITGIFAESILDECEDFIKHITDYIDKKLN
jgi:hypothetical protein